MNRCQPNGLSNGWLTSPSASAKIASAVAGGRSSLVDLAELVDAHALAGQRAGGLREARPRSDLLGRLVGGRPVGRQELRHRAPLRRPIAVDPGLVLGLDRALAERDLVEQVLRAAG